MLLQVMFSFFTVTTAAWFVHIYKNRSHTQRIHLLMGALGVFKALTLMTQVGGLEGKQPTQCKPRWQEQQHTAQLYAASKRFQKR